jgi:imidazolonepropionase-like amidohydrolase
MEFLVEQVHIPAEAVLRGVTGLAAEALGLADRLGTLEPGKLADIVIVDGNPLGDMTAMRRVHTVIKDGETLVRDGAMLWPTPHLATLASR